MRATGIATAIVCPAFPAQGRVVLDRVLLVDGVPVADTPIGRDPQFAAAPPSSVVEILRAADRPRARRGSPSTSCARGPSRSPPACGRLAGTAIVADAETDADLDALVEAALDRHARAAAGRRGRPRARAGDAASGLLAERVELPAGPRWLDRRRQPASGHATPGPRGARGRAHRARDGRARRPTSRRTRSARLVEQAVAALERERWDRVDRHRRRDGRRALERARRRAHRPRRRPRPRAGPRPPARRPAATALPLLTKAGGFGAPDLLVSLAPPEGGGR